MRWRRHSSIWKVQLLLAHHPVLGQADGAIVVGFGLHQSGSCFFQVGACRFQVGLRILQIGRRLEESALEQCRINEGDDVPFVYARIKIGVKLRNGSRNLRSYLNGDYRIDRSSGFDYISDLAALNLSGKVLCLSTPVEAQSDEQSSHNYNAGQDEPSTFCLHVKPEIPHSYRRASMGSSKDAFRAGYYPLNTPAATE